MLKKSLYLTVLLSWSTPHLGCKAPGNQPGSEINVLGNQRGQVKGLIAINNILATRLMSDGFDLIQDVYSNSVFRDIVNLLGGYEGAGIKNRFASGAPNAVNMLLWSTVMRNFGQRIAMTNCSSHTMANGRRFSDDSMAINQELKSLLSDCGDQNQTPSWRKDPNALWTMLIQEDAPPAEFDAWAGWIKSREFAALNKSPEDQLSAAVWTALMNPYFLLEH